MVVIGLIGVLMSITLPAIAGARRRAQVVAIQNEMRQGAIGIIAHAGDRSDRFPFDPSAFPLFGISYYWRAFIESEGTLRAGKSRFVDDFGPDYKIRYSPTCIAHPVYWGDGPVPIEDRGNPPPATWRTLDMIGPMRVSDVHFPSQKAILTFQIGGSAPGPGKFVLTYPSHTSLILNPLSLFAAADGSARQIQPERLVDLSLYGETLTRTNSTIEPVGINFGHGVIGTVTYIGVWGLDWR